MEKVSADTVFKEFKVRLERIGLDYQSPAKPWRHMGFGENHLGRRLALTPHLRPRLKKIKRLLDMLVMEIRGHTP